MINSKFVRYVNFQDVESADFVSVLNKQTTREHLIKHALFDLNATSQWIAGKVNVDSEIGCKVRAILVNDKLAGWCGIQIENDQYEMAIVVEDSYWGIGKRVFFDMLSWAEVLGHKTVYIHLLQTRPEYKFLHKISNRVYKSELLNDQFTTYELDVYSVVQKLSHIKKAR